MAVIPNVLATAAQTILDGVTTASGYTFAGTVLLDPPDEDDMRGKVVAWVGTPVITSVTRKSAGPTGLQSSAVVIWSVPTYFSVWENDAGSARTRQYQNEFTDAVLKALISRHRGGVPLPSNPTVNDVEIEVCTLGDITSGLYATQNEVTYSLVTIELLYTQHLRYVTQAE